MGIRRQARESALQALYLADVAKMPIEDAILSAGPRDHAVCRCDVEAVFDHRSHHMAGETGIAVQPHRLVGMAG